MNLSAIWEKLKKQENLILGILLYGITLVYIYEFSQITGKYEPWTTDEFFYYIEAKAISAYNLYQTPASLDGNTSYIGDFGFHGVSYALKDGWLAKLFFRSEDPPLLLINLLTNLTFLALILLFKPFSLNIRLKIALVVITHYVLFSFTLSYYQETIHYLLAVLALSALYLHYKKENTVTKNKYYLIYFLILIIIAITFRYGWFIWGLGLFPLAKNFSGFFKWALISIGIMAFGIFVSRYLYAPYPYDRMVADQIIRTEKFSLLNSINLVWQKFSSNIQLFLSPADTYATTVMRYLLLSLIIINTWYAIIKRNKFTIACTFIAWGYFFSALAFYHVYWAYDERALAVLNPLLAFSLIGNCNPIIFYPIIAIQLWFFPGIINVTKQRNNDAMVLNSPSLERTSKKTTFAKLKDIITDDSTAVIEFDVDFIVHRRPNYFIDFPIVNSKGHPIHYRLYHNGTDLRKTHTSKYFIGFQPDSRIPYQLIYSDRWMQLYRIY